MPTEIHECFLKLVRLGIGHCADKISGEIAWNDMQALAEQQGLYAIVLDGVEKQPASLRPPQDLLLEWIGEVLQNYEYRYNEYLRAIVKMARFYNSHGYKMMVLKGYGCSLDWPRPEHRPCGDIDIWQFGRQKEADAAMVREKGIEVDNSHHHHSVFNWGEFTVENHYDFINVYHHKSNAELEGIFKELGQDDTHYVEVEGERVYLPSQNLHALFLLKHTMNDFTSFSMTLRQLLDWAFFVEKHGADIDWKWLVGMLKKFHMNEFFNTINAICVENLGFEASIFHSVQFEPILRDRVLNDILNPRYTAEEPTWLIPRLMYKYKRWKSNGWKHEMCYNEGMWSAFWSGVWSHVLKPSSI